MTSTYQAWLNKDREWSGGYCSRTRKSSLTKVVPLTLLLTALVLGGVGLLSGGGVPGLVSGALGGLVFGLIFCGIYLAILTANLSPARYTRKLEQSVREGGVPGLVSGALGGLVFGLIFCGIYLAILTANLSPARYTRKLEQSVRELSMDETEREQLGKEMLDALEHEERVLSYEMWGPNSKGTPARVILTPHYILQEGSTPYAVLIRLSDIAEIRTGAERKIATTRGGSSKTHHYFTLYSIGFYRKDRFERGLDGNDLPDCAMGFFQEELRDEVVKRMQDGGLRVVSAE